MFDLHALNLRHLRALLEVRRCGSISAAAEAVHLSQPAVTQAIARLERIAGAALFSRSPGGMIPTGPGALLAARIERAFDLLRAGAAEAARRQRVPPPRVETAVTAPQLRALLAIADHRGFSAAARALGLSQPTIHRTARDLEQATGLGLFVATPKGVALTRPAEALARAARLMRAELDQAASEIEAWHGVERGSLSIGALPLARATVLPRALARFSAARPDMRVRVLEGPYGDLLHALRDGTLDMMVGALRTPAPEADIVQRPLLEDRLGIFAGLSHPLARAARLAPRDLAGAPWVVPAHGTPTRAFFDLFAARIGGAAPLRIIETSSMILVRGLLRQGDHLTMISASQMRVDADLGAVVSLPVDLDDTPRPIGLTCRRDWRPTAAQAHMLALLGELGADGH